MQTIVYEQKGFTWIDVVDPTQKELKELAAKYGLHSAFVKDCLDPKHLPKIEKNASILFFIVRTFDEKCSMDADSIQELTRKIAVFSGPDYVLTVHRKDQAFFKILKEKWIATSKDVAAGTTQPLAEPFQGVFTELLRETVNGYEFSISESVSKFELLEMAVFEATGSKPFNMKEGYFLKRRAFVMRRMMKLTSEIITRIFQEKFLDQTSHQDIKENIDAVIGTCDEVIEGVTSLLNLHLSIASQKTNDVMRLLTIISVFILPLNIITGIYGMNFEYMPELKWPMGYPLILLLMIGVSLGIYFWFKKKKIIQ